MKRACVKQRAVPGLIVSEAAFARREQPEFKDFVDGGAGAAILLGWRSEGVFSRFPPTRDGLSPVCRHSWGTVTAARCPRVRLGEVDGRWERSWN